MEVRILMVIFILKSNNATNCQRAHIIDTKRTQCHTHVTQYILVLVTEFLTLVGIVYAMLTTKVWIVKQAFAITTAPPMAHVSTVRVYVNMAGKAKTVHR